MFELIKSWFSRGRDSDAQQSRAANRPGGPGPRPGGRTIFIGDVHGCLPELEAMIERLAPTNADRVILLGDLINRGPDSAGVVRFVAESGFECLMGNHDHEFISDLDGSAAHRELARAIGPELCEWLARRPLYIEDPKFLAVHAGLQPGVDPADTRTGILLNIRTWDGVGERLNDSNNPPWYDFYTDSRPVFYGHWARKGLNLRENTFGLDSGCVYGRSLSAYVLETKELIQIKAAQTYYVPPSLRKQENQE